MYEFDRWPLALLAVAALVGTWGVWCIRRGGDWRQARWGRLAFMLSLMVAGGGSVVAVFCATRCLVPFGLGAGWLVLIMLWENPFHV